MATRGLRVVHRNEDPAPVAAYLLTFPELERAMKLGIVPTDSETEEYLRTYFGSDLRRFKEMILPYCRSRAENDFRSILIEVSSQLRALRFGIVRDGVDAGKLWVTLWLWGTPYRIPKSESA